QPHNKPIPWNQKSSAQQNLPWIDIETSLQWPAFCRLINILQNRNNRLFILVGPLNTHILTPPSQTKYQNILTAVQSYLTQQNIPHLIPPTLPSNLYADTSHPLAPGYQKLAQQLYEQLYEQLKHQYPQD
ncbi:MAG: hypothetical protein GY869_11775, partial [Planctomycetes bacterium]|nr:hypothetical protein [Planctomycetota bacterium]